GTVTNAMALLLEANQVQQADALYRERLANGRALMWLPAAREGVRCALGFVADEGRRLLVRGLLSTRDHSFYVNEVGLYARYIAEFELAENYLREAVELDTQAGDDRNAAIALG